MSKRPAEILATIAEPLGLSSVMRDTGDLLVTSPIDGGQLAALRSTGVPELDGSVTRAETAWHRWRSVPAPRRGELVRLLGEVLRRNKTALGTLVSLETGKILQEGLGEVQEMIDICDFAVGLSRQLYGLTIASERPGHRMQETWHPLGPVAIMTAFNFPVAVWSWNAAIALVCGDTLLWKPSEKDAAHRPRLPASARRGGGTDGRFAGRPVQRADRRAGARRGARRRCARSARQRHRQHAHGARGGTARRRPVRPHAARARRQQRDDRRALRRSRSCRPAPSCSPPSAPPGSVAPACAG